MNQDRQNSNAPGQSTNQGQTDHAASSPEKEERHQTARERTPTEERQNAASGPPENNPANLEREERIRRRAYQLWEEGGRQDGQAEDYWHRAAQDLEREDAELERSGSAGKNVGQNRT